MLHIVTGCMFAGKTSELVKIYNSNTNIVVLDYDTEAVIQPTKQIFDIEIVACNTLKQGHLYTHDNKSVPCTKLLNIQSLIDYTNYTIKLEEDIILINEGQFFTGLKEFVKCALENKKTVYVFGLDGDFKQKKFGEILDLIPNADTYKKLYAKCKCGDKASFSKRLSTFIGQYAPDDKYKPVCRNCL